MIVNKLIVKLRNSEMGPCYQRKGEDVRPILIVTRLLFKMTWLLLRMTWLLLRMTRYFLQ